MQHFFLTLGIFTPSSVLFIVLLAIWLHLKWSRKVAVTGPALLTTFGIFFCFAGITWGLVDFDPADIRDGVPRLLQGIRTSFWASVFGIGGALTIKLRVLIFGEPRPRVTDATSGATIDDLLSQLRQLEASVRGAVDTTLVEEIRASKVDSNGRLDQLTDSLKLFTANIVETQLKTLIRALAIVIRDFNTKIDEQFGQNFQDLNVAMGRLVVWQGQYEQQLNSLIEQETATRHNMAAAAAHFAEIVEKSASLMSIPDGMRQLLGQVNAQSDRLNTSLRNLADVVTAQIEQGAMVSHDTLSAVVKASTQNTESHIQELADMLKATLGSADKDRMRKAK